MKHLILIFVVAMLACSAKCQDKFAKRWPIRVVDGKKTDLTYLFTHWLTASNAITNTAWMRIAGKVVQDNAAGGWIVEGGTYTATMKETRQKFVLRNPPAFEKEKFDVELSKTLAAHRNDPPGGVSKESGKQEEVFAQVIASIPNDGNQYRVDGFALFTGKYENGMPIFDFGLISQ